MGNLGGIQLKQHLSLAMLYILGIGSLVRFSRVYDMFLVLDFILYGPSQLPASFPRHSPLWRWQTLMSGLWVRTLEASPFCCIWMQLLSS